MIENKHKWTKTKRRFRADLLLFHFVSDPLSYIYTVVVIASNVKMQKILSGVARSHLGAR